MAESTPELLADEASQTPRAHRAASVSEPGQRIPNANAKPGRSTPSPNDTSETTPSTDASSRAPRQSPLIHALTIALIGLAIAIIGGRNLTQGGVGWSDGANHLFDGIFVYELARAMPIDAPMTWAQQFYLHCPSLGIVVYWPPGFAAIEAIAFAVCGVSLVAARLLVLTFAFGAAYLMFRFVRDLYGETMGVIAAMLLATCPFGERWMTDIMLEWPATFWILLAVWAYVRGAFVSGGRAAACWSFACGISIAMAFLTKQTAGFILPVIGMHALMSRDGRVWLRRWLTLSGFALCGVVVVAYGIASRPYAGLASSLLALKVEPFWYARNAIEIFGCGILLAAVTGIILSILRPERASQTELRTPTCSSKKVSLYNASLFVFWFASWYGFSSAIEAKEPRYLFFALPPVVLLAACGIRALASLGAPSRTAKWRVGLLAAIVVVGNGTLAIANSRGRLPSYAPAVELLVERGDADLVLIDAVRDGQFVYDIYANDAARDRIIPLRASKLLYARAARMKYGGEIRVESEADIVAMLNELGIRYIVMESQTPRTKDASIDAAPRKLLRSLVSDSTRFTLRGEWPLACDDPDWDDVALCVYEYLDCPARTTDRVTIPVPAMGRDVEIELPR